MSEAQPRLLNGIALVTSGVVGAGMFSLPIVASGMWFGWAMFALGLVWLFNYLALKLLVESNLLQAPGASFDRIIRSSLGDRWAAINNLCIVFVMYILLYAYFSGGGSIVDNTLHVFFDIENRLPQNISSLLFGVVLGLVVATGTSLVSRLCIVLLLAMFITFFLSNANLVLALEIPKLLDQQGGETSYSQYIWFAIPHFVAAFACSGIVPSLVKYYQGNAQQVIGSLRYGTLLALGIYVFWLIACFGTLSRDEMVPVISAGGNTGDLVGALQANRGSSEVLLGLFSNFAIITSFLSIGLGLFDFMLDRFKLEASASGRFKAALLTFLPPAIFSFFYPKGFVLAIGYAGLVVLFSFYLVPVVMAIKNRRSGRQLFYRVSGGRSVLAAVMLFSLVAASFKVLGTFALLPVFP